MVSKKTSRTKLNNCLIIMSLGYQTVGILFSLAKILMAFRMHLKRLWNQASNKSSWICSSNWTFSHSRQRRRATERKLPMAASSRRNFSLSSSTCARLAISTNQGWSCLGKRPNRFGARGRCWTSATRIKGTWNLVCSSSAGRYMTTQRSLSWSQWPGKDRDAVED